MEKRSSHYASAYMLVALLAGVGGMVVSGGFLTPETFSESALAVTSTTYFGMRYVFSRFIGQTNSIDQNNGGRKVVDLESVGTSILRSFSYAFMVLFILKHVPSGMFEMAGTGLAPVFKLSSNIAGNLTIMLLVVAVATVLNVVGLQFFKGVKKLSELVTGVVKVLAILICFLHSDPMVDTKVINYQISHLSLEMKDSNSTLNIVHNKEAVNNLVDVFVNHAFRELEEQEVSSVDPADMTRVLKNLVKLKPKFPEREKTAFANVSSGSNSSEQPKSYHQKTYANLYKAPPSNSTRINLLVESLNNTSVEKVKAVADVIRSSDQVVTSKVQLPVADIDPVQEIVEQMVKSMIGLEDVVGSSKLSPIIQVVGKDVIDEIEKKIAEPIAKVLAHMLEQNNLTDNRLKRYSLSFKKLIPDLADLRSRTDSAIQWTKKYYRIFLQGIVQADRKPSDLSNLPKGTTTYTEGLQRQLIANLDKIKDAGKTLKRDKKYILNAKKQQIEKIKRSWNDEFEILFKDYKKEELQSLSKQKTLGFIDEQEYNRSRREILSDSYKEMIKETGLERQLEDYDKQIDELIKERELEITNYIEGLEKRIQGINKVNADPTKLLDFDFLLDELSPGGIQFGNQVSKVFGLDGECAHSEADLCPKIRTIIVSKSDENEEAWTLEVRLQDGRVYRHENSVDIDMFLRAYRFVFSPNPLVVLIDGFYVDEDEIFGYNDNLVGDVEFRKVLYECDKFIFRLLGDKDLAPLDDNGIEIFQEAKECYERSKETESNGCWRPSRSRIHDGSGYEVILSENLTFSVAQRLTYSLVKSENGRNREIRLLSDPFNENQDWILDNYEYFNKLYEFAQLQGLLRSVDSEIQVDVTEYLLQSESLE